MSLKDFLAKSAAAAPKPFDKDSANKEAGIKVLYMNAPMHQGNLKFIPVTPVKGSEIKYLYDVMEFQVYTEKDDGDKMWRWGRIPQVKDFNDELTQEQINQVSQIQSQIKSIIDLGYGTDWARSGKNYALMFGYVLNHINTDKEVISDINSRELCLLVLPSKNVAKAVTTMLETMDENSQGEMIYKSLFNRNSTGRNTYLEMSFKRGSGFGYDVVMNYKAFDMFAADILTPEEQKVNSVNIPEDLIEKATTQTAVFAGNREDDSDFIQEYIDRLGEQVSAEIAKTVSASKLPDQPAPPIDPDANKPSADNWPTA